MSIVKADPAGIFAVLVGPITGGATYISIIWRIKGEFILLSAEKAPWAGTQGAEPTGASRQEQELSFFELSTNTSALRYRARCYRQRGSPDYPSGRPRSA